MGSVLGGVLSLTNLYIGLKAGWGFGVAITACILSYAIWTTCHKIGLARTKMTILENNCMQSTASSAGYSTGGTLISAFAAYIMLNNETLPIPLMLGWVFFLAVLGVTMAVPMKRQMINIEQLRFPSGIAAAETLRALHSTGDKGIARGAGPGHLRGCWRWCSKFWTEGLHLISARAGPVPSSQPGRDDLQREDLRRRVWMGRTVMFVVGPHLHRRGHARRACAWRAASCSSARSLCWMVFVP